MTTNKPIKSKIVALREKDILAQSNRALGEEHFIVDPLMALILDIKYSHALTQVPVVTYSIQSVSECVYQSSIISRSESGFQVIIHNMDSDRVMDGLVLWHVFVIA